MISILQELIEGGFIGQAIISTIVWGTIAILMIRQLPIDDRLFDGAFIVLGYFFHVATTARSTRKAVKAERRANGFVDEVDAGHEVG